MRWSNLLLPAAMAALAASSQVGHAQEGTFYTATYVELAPTASQQGANLLTAYREASRKDDGLVRFDVATHIHRRSQFLVLMVWKDPKAFDAHAATAHAKQFEERLQPIVVSPNDQRLHNVLTVAPAKEVLSPALYVVTHVDVPGPRKDDVIPLLNQLAEESRKEVGNLRFDIWQQSNRPNHFTVVEAWSDQNAFDSHLVAVHTKQFRAKLVPMTGALYDERLYQPFQ
jgi:quinol monooxygenase YgiN